MEEELSLPDGDGGRHQDFDYRVFIAEHDGATIADYEIDQVIYAQGDPADALFYIISGTVIVTTISEQGKEAVIAILGHGDFFGEGCVDGILLRRTTIKCATPAKIARLKQATVLNALKDRPGIFFNFLILRSSS